ncbi:UdgX family uracil-DNA binding protein [Aestuariivirga sp.]|uniref:UdgX family uracil-DNA binding protein n=1 Tax=Aestuariivirga sp. TaxID=2650926 RepID=UPI00391BBFCF
MDRKPKRTLESDMPLLEGADVPVPATLEAAREQAKSCTRCHLYRLGTQTVFGEGPSRAPVMFVGEQPGDKEDLAGRPFVGPAGRLFDTLLEEVGIDRAKCYVTNAVKHFKHEPRGSFRLHKKPDAPEIEACKWWLRIETAIVKPKLFVALGATAAQSLTGDGRGILKRRGGFEETRDGRPILITIHPSALLRIPQARDAAAARQRFREDLALILEKLPGIALAA